MSETPTAESIANNTMVSLLFVALAPSFPRAACKGSHSVFDSAALGRIEDQAVALDICGNCVEIAACTAWADTMTSDELVTLGVVAGVCHAPVRSEGQIRRCDQRTDTKQPLTITRWQERRDAAQRRRDETARRRAERRRERLERRYDLLHTFR